MESQKIKPALLIMKYLRKAAETVGMDPNMLNTKIMDCENLEQLEHDVYKQDLELFNPNYIDERLGVSAMHLSAGENINIVRYMLLQGGDPNLRSTDGLTPVHVAASWGNSRTLQLLLEYGGDSSVEDEDGMLPIDYAKENENTNCVSLLSSQQDTNSSNSAMRTVEAYYDRRKCPEIKRTEKRLTNIESSLCPANFISIQPKLYPPCVSSSLNSNIRNSNVNNLSNNDNHKQFNSCRQNEITPVCSINHESPTDKDLRIADFILQASEQLEKCHLYDADSDASSLENMFERSLDYFSDSTFVTCDEPSLDLCQRHMASHRDFSEFSNRSCQNRFTWKPPTEVVSDGDLMTSDESVTQEISTGYNHLLHDKDEKASSPTYEDSQSPSALVLPSFQCTTLEHNTLNSKCLKELKKLSDNEIAARLKQYGEKCGPVNQATRNVYIKRLVTLESNRVRPAPTPPETDSELDMSTMGHMEINFSKSFLNCDHTIREGKSKCCFNYLLLDPRKSDNLPQRAKKLSTSDSFKTFMHSIFYIGKGTSSRPYCHLHEAVSKKNKSYLKKSCKVKQILDIWDSGHGVLFVQFFQSCIPAEAYTREACMLEAIGLENVTNVKKGNFYGCSKTWPKEKQRKFGFFLLRKALKIFLVEGEKPIFISDLKGNI